MKKIQDFIDEITDISKVLIEYARKVRALIDYILSLPAKLYELLKDCLSNFLSAVAKGLADLFTLPGVDVSGIKSSTDVTALFSAIGDAAKAGLGVVESSAKLIAVPVEVAGALLTPSTVADQNKMANTIISYLSTNSANSNTATDMGFALGQFSSP